MPPRFSGVKWFLLKEFLSFLQMELLPENESNFRFYWRDARQTPVQWIKTTKFADFFGGYKLLRGTIDPQTPLNHSQMC